MSRRNLRGFNFERLENRRLLAADFGVEVMQCDFVPAETCEVQTVVEVEVGEMECEPGEMELESSLPPEIVDGIENVPTSEVETGIVDDSIESTAEVSEGEMIDAVSADQFAISAIELNDPVLGTSGYFGELSPDDSSQTLRFTPSEDGVIDVVITSSIGESLTNLEVLDAAGNLMDVTSTEQMDGFEKLTFDATAGETYQLAVSSDDVCNGFFMVTVDFSTVPEPVDFHVDEIGADSTELVFTDGIATLDGELEMAGDVDTFRLVADSDGKAILHLSETDGETATELHVSVYDASGEVVTRGLTNEKVLLSFDVAKGSEYFVAVHATEDQVGTYSLELEMPTTPVGTIPVDLHADEIGDQATLLTLEDGSVSVSGALETAEDRDAFRVVSPTDGEMVVDVTSTSENHSSDASVSVFGPEGDLIVAGGTNEEVAIRFDSNSDVEYQVLIDSTNDIPADYELTIRSFASVIEPTQPMENMPTEEETVPVEDDVALIDDDMSICDADVDAENGLIDGVFAEIGENLETDLGSGQTLNGRRGLRSFRQI